MNYRLACLLAEGDELLPPSIAHLCEMVGLEAGHRHIRKLFLLLSHFITEGYVLSDGRVGSHFVIEVISPEEGVEIHDICFVGDHG